MMFRAAVGTSSALVQVDARQRYTVFVGVTDVSPGAKTTMGMIAAEAHGPFGAKTVGESGIILAPAAVANAIFNATGTRMTSLPMSRDKLLGAMG